MATYQELQKYVDKTDGFQPETCWIAHVMVGLPLRRAWNHRGNEREVPCPPDKVEPIKSAFRYFRMIR